MPDDRHIAHAPISKAFVGGAKIEHMPAHTHACYSYGSKFLYGV